MREDNSLIRRGDAAEKFAVLRYIALNMFNADMSSKAVLNGNKNEQAGITITSHEFLQGKKFRDLALPPKELMDRLKMGFAVPLIDWFKEDLKDYLLDYLNEENLRKTGILTPGPVIKMRDNYLSGDSADITKLWCLLVFMFWWERWM